MGVVLAVAEEGNHEQNGARLCSSCSLIMWRATGSASQTRKEAGTSGKAGRIFSELGPRRSLPGGEILSEHEVILLGRPVMSALPCPRLLSSLSKLRWPALRAVASFRLQQRWFLVAAVGDLAKVEAAPPGRE
jgi:hypothetical protein